jgi:hypothetical protein
MQIGAIGSGGNFSLVKNFKVNMGIQGIFLEKKALYLFLH